MYEFFKNILINHGLVVIMAIMFGLEFIFSHFIYTKRDRKNLFFWQILICSYFVLIPFMLGLYEPSVQPDDIEPPKGAREVILGLFIVIPMVWSSIASRGLVYILDKSNRAQEQLQHYLDDKWED
jgi:hypothetical protein